MVSVCFRRLESSSFAEFVRAYKDLIPREGFSNHKGGRVGWIVMRIKTPGLGGMGDGF